MTYPKINLNDLPEASNMVAAYNSEFPCDMSNCNATEAWVILQTYVYA